MNRQSPKILAIIPCYNEAGSIGNLLREFSALDFPCDTLVIDDGSKDQTYHIAKEFSQAVRLEKNQGLPAGIKLGIRYALENGYDYSIQIDGDGQHVPTQISMFMHALETCPANILIGSRYCERLAPFKGGMRRMAGLIISFQLRLMFGRWLCDPLSGMRMMDSKAMNYFIQHLDERSLDAVTVPQALHAGFSIVEVAVKMRPRESGSSYVGGLKGIKFMVRLMWKICAIKLSQRLPASSHEYSTGRTEKVEKKILQLT